jgi:hypothetical protein
MKKWSVGELQAIRAAARFLIGLGMFVTIISVFLLVLYVKLPPEEKTNNVHKDDLRNGSIILVLAAVAEGGGWKLRSYVKKCEKETGLSSQPFGWMP